MLHRRVGLLFYTVHIGSDESNVSLQMASASSYVCEGTTNDENTAGKRKRSGFECAVNDCSLRHSDGVKMHGFPKDSIYKSQWVNFVRTCRENFVPTTYSKICSMHFTPDCYPATYAMQESLGFKIKFKQLKPTAVPTIQKHALSKPGKKWKKDMIKGTSDSVTFSTPVQLASFATTPDSTTAKTSSTQMCTTSLKTTDSVKTPLMCVMEATRLGLGDHNLRGAHTKRECMRMSGVVPDHQINGPFSIDQVPDLNVDFQTSFLRSVNKIQSVCSNYSDSDILCSKESTHTKNVQDTSSEMTACKVLVAVDLPSTSGENCKTSTDDQVFCHHPTRLLETKGNHDKNLKSGGERKKNMRQFPLKVKGPVKRVPNANAGSSKIVSKTIKMKGNPETGMTSVPCEQSLVAPQLYRIVALDELLKSYTLIPPAVPSTSCLGPLSSHERGNHSSVRKQRQTWTATSDQHSAEFHCDGEVKQEVSSDQEGSPVLSSQLEVCAIKKHAVVEQPSHCISHQGTVTTNKACSHEIALLQPKCELQSTRTRKKVLSSYSSCLKRGNQDKHHINMINPAFIKKEPKDFETLWNAEPLMDNHNSESKTGTEITKAVSEESPSVYKLDSAFIKKESEDFDSSWSTPSVTQTNNSFENKMGTKIYPTGVYRNVHFAHLMTSDYH